MDVFTTAPPTAGTADFHPNDLALLFDEGVDTLGLDFPSTHKLHHSMSDATDSGFSSPMDSPKEDWYSDLTDSFDVPPRSRLTSLSVLPTFECLTGNLPELDSHGHHSLLGLNNCTFFALDEKAVAHVDDTFNFHLKPEVSISSMTQSPAHTVIDPGLLLTADFDEEEEIDVVGDDDSQYSSPSSLSRVSSLASNYISGFGSQDLLTPPPLMEIKSFPQLPTSHIPSIRTPAAAAGPSTSTAASLSASSTNTSTTTTSKPARAGPYPKRNSERKRHLHNELERKRREDLNATFFRLGDLLPNLKTGNTAPTQVHILQSAASYIRELRDNQSQLSSTRSSLVAENQRLQQRLSELRTICIA